MLRRAGREAASEERSESARPGAAGAPLPANNSPLPRQRPRACRANAAADAPANEWVGTITSLRQREPNLYLITLDNGQVWAQHVAERYALRVGQRVRVYQSKWGSSQRLEADGVKGFIQVELVR